MKSTCHVNQYLEHTCRFQNTSKVPKRNKTKQKTKDVRTHSHKKEIQSMSVNGHEDASFFSISFNPKELRITTLYVACIT